MISRNEVKFATIQENNTFSVSNECLNVISEHLLLSENAKTVMMNFQVLTPKDLNVNGSEMTDWQP
jgi:hypothetical protein